MRLKSLSDLKAALEIAPQATPTPSIPGDFSLPGAPDAPERPTLADHRALRLATMAAWYTTVTQEKTREPDPFRDYLGPRFLPPKARLPARKGHGNLG